VNRVIRQRSGAFYESFRNYLACVYLERQNFECTASYNIDGGVSVISRLTRLIRTSIIRETEYDEGFSNEVWKPPIFHPLYLFPFFWPYLFYQLLVRIGFYWQNKADGVGPLKADGDHYMARYMVNHGWKTIFHNHPDAVIETTLGSRGTKRFWGKLICSTRTNWRSNLTSLFHDHICWSKYTWTTYAMFLSSFFNFALFVDPLLFFTLYMSGYWNQWCNLALVLLATKLNKPVCFLLREKNLRDLPFVLLGLLFGYFHSIIKLWAFLTADNIAWIEGDIEIVDERSVFEKAADPVIKLSTLLFAFLGWFWHSLWSSITDFLEFIDIEVFSGFFHRV
jgi:hypothetical protein